MQCKCGGSTQTQAKVKNKEAVSRYCRCTSCGKLFWFYKESTTKIINQQKQIAQKEKVFFDKHKEKEKAITEKIKRGI